MRKFGITSETRGSSNVSIPAPIKLAAPNPMFKTGYEFPLCRLVAVQFVADKKVKRAGAETSTYVLQFLFKDDKDRQYTHIEWPLDPTSKNAAKEPEWQDQRIKHIWEETIGADKLPKDGLGTSAQTENDYFRLVAEGFNAVKVSVLNPKYKPNQEQPQPDTNTAEAKDADPKAIKLEKEGEKAEVITQTVERVAYGQTYIYIKLTYNKTNLQMPLFPNFVQRAARDGKQIPVETLTIDLKYDQVEPSVSVTNNPAAGLSTGLDATFGGTNFTEDLPDFLQ